MEIILENPRRKTQSRGAYSVKKKKKPTRRRKNPRVTVMKERPYSAKMRANKRKGKKRTKRRNVGIMTSITQTGKAALPVIGGAIGSVMVAGAITRGKNLSPVQKALAVGAGGLLLGMGLRYAGQRRYSQPAMLGGFVGAGLAFAQSQFGAQTGLSGLGAVKGYKRNGPPIVEMSASTGARSGLPVGVYLELADGTVLKEGVSDYVPFSAGLGDYVPRQPIAVAQPYSQRPTAPPRRRLVVSAQPLPSRGPARASAIAELRAPGQSIMDPATYATTRAPDPARARIPVGGIQRITPPPDITATATRLVGGSGTSLAGFGDHTIGHNRGGGGVGPGMIGGLGSIGQAF